MKLTITVDKSINVGAIKAVIEANRVQIETSAAKAVEGLMKRRIFNAGKRTDGGAIGNYKQYTWSFKREDFIKPAKFKPNVEGGEWMTLSDGWGGGTDSVRALNGRQISYVDLDYTGSLRSALVVGKDSGGRVVLGFVSLEEAKKSEHLEDLYGRVFTPSLSEIEAGKKAAQRQISVVLRQNGYGTF
jgi:hypothetical protein